MKIGEVNFRQIHRKFVVLKDDRIKKQLEDVEFPLESDSILTWCYYDSQCGITFEFICPFNSKSKKSFEIADKDFAFKFRKGGMSDTEMEIISHENLKLSSETLNYIKSILEIYESDEELNETRRLAYIDHLRNESYFDDIRVLLYRQGFKPEVVWLRLTKLKDDNLIGKLLNQPLNDLGVSIDDKIVVGFYQDEDKILRAVCVL